MREEAVVTVGMVTSATAPVHRVLDVRGAFVYVASMNPCNSVASTMVLVLPKRKQSRKG